MAHRYGIINYLTIEKEPRTIKNERFLCFIVSPI
jgi:hypothetical protein